jgi:hypothetical protein
MHDIRLTERIKTECALVSFKESFQEFVFVGLTCRRIVFAFGAEQGFANVPGKRVHVSQIRIAKDNDVDFFAEALRH